MTEDTPLVEVVELLPVDLARALMAYDSYGQQYVVKGIRTTVSTWEAQGVELDPVQFDVVLQSVAVQLMGAWQSITQLQRRLLEGEAHAS